jgi:DNA adenine methylase
MPPLPQSVSAIRVYPDNAKPDCRPFLKWPGGKSWATAYISNLIRPHLLACYFEPFLGGGAVFFHLRPPTAVLGDRNAELISAYRAIRESPMGVEAILRRMPVEKNYFYSLRGRKPKTKLGQAARFLYLNRVAFNGIFRVNRDGAFNVPFGGRSPDVLWKHRLLEHASGALAFAELKCTDFEDLMDAAGVGDVVYCDPTYTVAHDNNGFVRYNERNFSWADQIRLSTAAARASARGALVLVSNAHHPSVQQLYGGAETHILERPSRVSARLTGRRTVREYLFVLRPATAGEERHSLANSSPS